jgi:formamidopyrimidine-DNA glycosylase
MTGSMMVMEPGAAIHKHAHVIMEADDGSHLCFVDQRRFGTWTKVANCFFFFPSSHFALLGQKR